MTPDELERHLYNVGTLPGPRNGHLHWWEKIRQIYEAYYYHGDSAMVEVLNKISPQEENLHVFAILNMFKRWKEEIYKEKVMDNKEITKHGQC